MSAPFYMVSALGEPSYPAPIHMYYGDGDPNYTGGSASALAAQWDRLGVPNETDVRAGFGHSSWPAESIGSGLAFLLAHRHPGASPSSRCGDPDAGVSAPDAQAALDASGESGLDAGAGVVGGDGGALDARPVSDDAARTSRAIASGCACRAGRAHGRAGAMGWVVVLGLASSRRLRRAIARARRPR